MKVSFWIQLGLALIAVLSILAIIQGMAMARRERVVAYATEVCTLVELDPERIAQGRKLYGLNCAGCHGVNLEGAPNWDTRNEDGSWPPPPLNSSAHAWQHSDGSLIQTITNGRSPGKTTSMPAFGTSLSKEEIRSIVEFIKSNWGDSERSQQQLLNSPDGS